MLLKIETMHVCDPILLDCSSNYKEWRPVLQIWLLFQSTESVSLNDFKQRKVAKGYIYGSLIHRIIDQFCL